jgi:hypothetical protein
MDWRTIELHVDGQIHRASYRSVGAMVEMSTVHGAFSRPRGNFLPELCAREMLRKLIRRTVKTA